MSDNQSQSQSQSQAAGKQQKEHHQQRSSLPLPLRASPSPASFHAHYADVSPMSTSPNGANAAPLSLHLATSLLSTSPSPRFQDVIDMRDLEGDDSEAEDDDALENENHENENENETENENGMTSRNEKERKPDLSIPVGVPSSAASAEVPSSVDDDKCLTSSNVAMQSGAIIQRQAPPHPSQAALSESHPADDSQSTTMAMSQQEEKSSNDGEAAISPAADDADVQTIEKEVVTTTSVEGTEQLEIESERRVAAATGREDADVSGDLHGSEPTNVMADDSKDVPAAGATPDVVDDATMPDNQMDDAAALFDPFSTDGDDASSVPFLDAYRQSLTSTNTLESIIADECRRETEEDERTEREYEREKSKLQQALDESAQAIERIEREREEAMEKQCSTKAEVDDWQSRLGTLRSAHTSLVDRLTLLQTRRNRHILEQYLRRHPLHVLLQHNAGSRSGAHRAFLKQWRRARRMSQQMKNENIHGAYDSSDEEGGAGDADNAAAVSPSVANERDDATAAPILLNDVPSDYSIPVDPSSNTPILPPRYGLFRERGEDGSPRLILPSGVIVHLFTFLGARDLCRAQATCKAWNEMVLGPRKRNAAMLERINASVTATADAVVSPITHVPVWKHMLERVVGVDARLRRERAKERIQRRPTIPTTQKRGRVQQHGTLPYRDRTRSNVDMAPPILSPLMPSTYAGSTTLPSATPEGSLPSVSTLDAASSPPSATPPATSPQRGANLTPGPASVPPPQSPLTSPLSSNTPSIMRASPSPTPGSASTPGRGLLGGMLRRFGTMGPATPASASASRAIAASNPNAHKPLRSPDLPPGQRPTHLHYTLTIHITPKTHTYTLGVEARVVPSGRDDPQQCSESEPEGAGLVNGSEKGDKGNSAVAIRLCSLAASKKSSNTTSAATASSSNSQLDADGDRDFCVQVFAMQANLMQAKMEKAKTLAQMDSDEGLKRQLTHDLSNLNSTLQSCLSACDDLEKQNGSDDVTLRFLDASLSTTRSTLDRERAATIQMRHARECKVRARQHAKENFEREMETAKQAHQQLKQIKKQLSKEVKARQTELEMEKRELAEMKEELERKLAALSVLKEASSRR